MLLQVADDQAFTTNVFTFEVYPSDVEIPDGDNLRVDQPLDGMAFTQSPMQDYRPLVLIFNDLVQHTHWAGSETIINELRSRRYHKTGSNYYLRAQPEYDANSEGTSGTVTGSDFDVSPDPGWTVDEWIDYALVDSAYSIFRITDNDSNTLNWDTDEGTPADGNFTVVDRKANFLYRWNEGQGDAPIEVRILMAQLGTYTPTSLQKTIYPLRVEFHPVFS